MLIYISAFKIFEGRELALLVLNVTVMHKMNSINVELLPHQIYVAAFDEI